MHRQSPFARRGELESNGGASERRSCRGGTKSDAKDRISVYRVCLCRPSCSDIACVRVIFPAASTCAGAISGIAGSTILLAGSALTVKSRRPGPSRHQPLLRLLDTSSSPSPRHWSRACARRPARSRPAPAPCPQPLRPRTAPRHATRRRAAPPREGVRALKILILKGVPPSGTP